MDSILNFTVDLAKGAGYMLQKSFKRSGTRASKKADNSVVTDADLAADRWITEQIQAQYPSDRIISEELHVSLDSGRGKHLDYRPPGWDDQLQPGTPLLGRIHCPGLRRGHRLRGTLLPIN